MMTEKQKSWGMFGLSLSIVVIVIAMACLSGCIGEIAVKHKANQDISVFAKILISGVGLLALAFLCAIGGIVDSQDSELAGKIAVGAFLIAGILGIICFAVGCVEIDEEALIQEEKLKGLVDAKIEGAVGFAPGYKAKLLETINGKLAGDDVLGDLVKDNLSLQMKISTQADTINELENIGRDKWDFSGGALIVMIGLSIALFLSFLTNLGQRSFIKALAMAIYTRKEVSGQETKTMANKVKTQTRKGGIINRLGGWIGDKIIKRNNINALAK